MTLRPLLLAGFMAALSLILVTLSVPALFAELNRQLAADTLRQLREEGQIGQLRDLDLAVRAMTVSTTWNQDAERDVELANLLLAQSIRDYAAGRDAIPTIERASDVVERSLALNPTSHLAWNLLARISLITGRNGIALGAIQRSYRVVPVDHNNAYGRIPMALQLLPALDRDTLSLLAVEMTEQARRDMRKLAVTALGNYRADDVRILLEAAGADEALIEQFVTTSRRLLGSDAS